MTPKAPFLALSLLAAQCQPVVSFTASPTTPKVQPWSTGSDQLPVSLAKPTWQLWAGKDGRSGDDSSSRKVTNEKDEIDQLSGRFARGEELKRLRADLDSLRENLGWAEAMEDQDRIDDLAKAIRNGENRDPDIVYRRALRGVIDAKASFKLSDDEKQRRVKKWQNEAAAARRHLPRFQMEGLWVGK